MQFDEKTNEVQFCSCLKRNKNPDWGYHNSCMKGLTLSAWYSMICISGCSTIYAFEGCGPDWVQVRANQLKKYDFSALPELTLHPI